MKILPLIFIVSLLSLRSFSQLEISTGYAIDRNQADGVPIEIGYDFNIKNRLYTKSQIGYKYLYHFNDFVGATMKVSIMEFHQMISYEIIKKEKYIFKPNIGLNYRFYKWKGEMISPLNSLPIRAWVIGLRDKENFILESTGENYYKEYKSNNPGFSFQLQNQFYLNKNLWLHVTPFIEPDYDRSQNNGGCYVGIIFKNL